MNNFWNNVGYPLCIMILGGLVVRYLNPYVPTEVITILIATTCFALGVSMHQRKRSKGWVQKFVIAFFFLFFVFWDLGYIVLPELKNAFNFIGINGFVIKLFYVFCGWSFFK